MRIRDYYTVVLASGMMLSGAPQGLGQALAPGQAAPPAIQRPAAAPSTPVKAAPLQPLRQPVLAQPAFPATPPEALAWDKELKELVAKPGETNILVTFSFTNRHSSEVVIKSVRPSCGCTTVELPALPWTIPSGSNGQVAATLDLRNKRGVLTKSLMVDSTSGFKSLLFKVTIPGELNTSTVDGEAIDPDRLRNMQMTMVDRQVVFKNQECAKCHAEPAEGKMGHDLYVAACAICHDTPHRATMVPDLKQLKFPTSAPYWKYWIVNGRPGSLMPAFATSRGGPLTDEQIESLVAYLTETISGKPRTTVPPQLQSRPAPVKRPAPPPGATLTPAPPAPPSPASPASPAAPAVPALPGAPGGN